MASENSYCHQKFQEIAVRNLHEVSHQYSQEYIDEFVFLFNRRFLKPQLPDRLRQATVDYVPIRTSLNSAQIHVKFF